MVKEYLLSTKTRVLLILMLFIHFAFLSPVRAFSTQIGCKITPFLFPFQMSSIYFQLLFMLGVVYLFSFVPCMQYWNMYRLMRLGRIRWALEQLRIILALAFFYTVMNLFMSILLMMDVTAYRLEWGKGLYTLSLTNAGGEFGNMLQFSYAFINDYTPLQALAASMVISFLCVAFIGIFMFFVSLWVNRTMAILLAMLGVVLPAVVENMTNSYQKFIFFSPLSWINFPAVSKYLSVQRIIVVLSLLTLTTILGILFKIKVCEFDWYNEE